MISELVQYGVSKQGKEMRILGALSTSEMRVIESLKEQLHRFNGIESLFKMALENYLELTRFLEKEEKEEGAGIEKFKNIGFQTNRILINYLSSTKMFIEHTEMNIKRYYGFESANFKTWKIATNNEYDNHVEYRFLYQLRNYTQHIGLPIGSVSRSLITNDRESAIRINFHRDSLLEANFNWKKVRDDIANMPGKFSIFPIINKYNGCMARLYQAALKAIVVDLMEAVDKYMILLNERDLKGTPYIVHFKNQKDRLKTLRGLESGNNNLDIHPLPFEEIQKCIEDVQGFKVANIVQKKSSN